jgi:hypothetical protein
MPSDFSTSKISDVAQSTPGKEDGAVEKLSSNNEWAMSDAFLLVVEVLGSAD